MRPRENRILKIVDSIFLKCVTVSLSIVDLIVVVPPLGILIATLFLYRSIVICFTKAIHGPNQALTPLDLHSSFLAGIDDIYNAPTNVMVGAVILEGTPDLEIMKQTVEDQWLSKKDSNTGDASFPQFLEPLKYIGGVPFWNKGAKVEKQRILEECVKIYKPDGKDSCDNSKLLEISKEFSLKPFPKDLPLWEIIVMPKYEPHPVKDEDLSPDKSYFPLILRIHHSVCDGLSMLWLTPNLSFHSPKQDVPLFSGDEAQGSSSNWRNHFKSCLKFLGKCILGFYELVEVLLLHIVVDLESPFWPTGDTNLDSLQGKERLSVARPAMLQMTAINNIKVTQGVSGMSVIILGALRAVKETLLEDVVNPIPTFIQVAMPLPIPRSGGKLQNLFTFCSLFLPVFVEDPVRHLHLVEKGFSQLKDSTQPYVNLLLMWIAGTIPNGILRFFSSRLSGISDNIGLSSIMGPKQLTDISGYPFMRLIVSSAIPIRNRFTVLYFSSIDGRAYFGGVADKMVIPSDFKAEELSNNFIEELEILTRLETSFDEDMS